MRRPALSAEKRLRIAELCDEGWSQRQVAAELGINQSTVVRHAKAMGLTFDRSATIAATSAKLADCKALRTEEAHASITEAKAERLKLHQPCRIAGIVGGMNAGIYTEVLPRPPAADRKVIVANYQALINTHLRLVEADLTDDSTDHARSLLGGLMQQMQELTAVDGWLKTMTNNGRCPNCDHDLGEDHD